MENYTVVILLIPLLFSGCCWSDYTTTIKKIAEPMQNKLVSFYQKNKRYPDVQERNQLLQESGCKMIGNQCGFLGTNFLVQSKENFTLPKDYLITLSLETSGCNFGLNFDGDSKKFSCGKTDCISIKQ